MRLAVLLFSCALTFGQNTLSAPETKSQAPANSPGQESHKNDSGLGMGTKVHVHHSVEVLPQGVDGRYLMEVEGAVYERWSLNIPKSLRMRAGKLAIAFEITRDGHIENMRLAASSGDAALDCLAWRSITDTNPFPPLPSEFTGQYLPMRIPFYNNLDSTDDQSDDLSPLSISKSDVRVSISAPGNLQVPVGGSEVVTAKVTGSNEQGVEWRITGPGCSVATLGKMMGDVYIAPRTLPDPAVVTLTAFSRADPTAKASVTVHIVQHAAQTSSKP